MEGIVLDTLVSQAELITVRYGLRGDVNFTPLDGEPIAEYTTKLLGGVFDCC